MVVRTRAIKESSGGVIDDACVLTYYGCRPADWEETADEKRFVEFIDGRLIVHAPAGLTHQDLFDFAYRLLGNHVEARKLGRVLAGPFAMDLSADRKFEPDIMFLSRRAAANLTDDRLLGPADLAIEIASTSTRGYDRGEKRECYRVGGVREYWMIDPIDRVVTLDRPAGTQVARASEGVLRSELCAGFWLRAEWLWAGPLPPVAHCLDELLRA
ncbi:MAG: Uma2 family endonuclease [Phycisphaerae bacterium]